MLKDCIKKVISQEALSVEEAERLMHELCESDFRETQMAAFLVAIHTRGEKEEELVGFLKALRSRTIRLTHHFEDAIDNCGTGGDGRGTFNISTACAFVLASGGVKVAKHGGPSVSSLCGSADVLDALGVPIAFDSETAVKNLEKFNCAFMFAPAFNPALKKFGALRKELGVRTCFNLMGPLLNPAMVKRQVMGVYEKKLLPMVARLHLAMGAENVIVVHSRDGLDEFSVSESTNYCHLRAGKIETNAVAPEDVGLTRYPIEAISGGDAIMNAQIMQSVFQGEKCAYRDVVLMNSAAGFLVAGKVVSLSDGVKMAADCIDSGNTLNLLKKIKKGV